jgi:hypothetical protein
VIRPAVSAIISVLVFVSARAAGQDRYSYNYPDARVTREDLEEFITEVAIHEEESTFIRSLYADLTNELKEGHQEYRNAVQRAGEAEQRWRRDHPESRNALADTGEDFGRAAAYYNWQRTYDALEARFLDDVEAVLSGAARDLWKVRRIDLHRRNLFRDMRSGTSWNSGRRSNMDLIAVVHDLQLSPEVMASLSELLEHYRAQMHEMIHDWRERSIDHTERMMAAFVPANLRGTPEGDARAARWNEIWDEWFTMGDAICDVNDEFIARFQAALPEADRTRFEEEISRLWFPSVFIPCPIELAIELLRQAPVGDDSRAAAESIWSDYREQRDQLRKRIVTISGQFETSQRMSDLQRQYRDMQDEYSRTGIWSNYDMPDDHPANPLFMESRRLAERAARNLRALFTDSEFAQLPLSVQLALEWWKE